MLLSCDGCKHKGKYKKEIEASLPSPCTGCQRRCSDNYDKVEMHTDPTDLISIDELCEILSIGHNMAYRLLNSKQIKAFRIGRVWKISRVAVEEFILTQTQNQLPQKIKPISFTAPFSFKE